jgi:DNA-binding transcriptional ArsR family regulator
VVARVLLLQRALEVSVRPHSPPSQAHRTQLPAPSHHLAVGDRAQSEGAGAGAPALGWSFLSKHAHVLVCLEEDPQIRIRALAVKVGLSPRAVLRTLDDLERAHYITRRRARRGTCYEVHTRQARRCPVIGDLHIADLVQLIRGEAVLSRETEQ